MIRRALAAAALICGGCGADTPPAAVPGPPPASPSASEAAAPPSAAPVPTPFHFAEDGIRSGLVAPSWCGGARKPHLLDSQGNGVALLDYDGDTDLDLFQVSGWRTEPGRVVERPGNRLWRNRGDGTFEDATAAAGIAGNAWGAGAGVGDVDGDGRPDLLVTNFGPDDLWRNRGDGTFERVPGFTGIDGWSTGGAIFDADGDGDEDVYVAAYIDATLAEVLAAAPTLDWKERKVAFGPFGLPGKANAFFRNEGNLRFVEASAETGLADAGKYFSFAAAAFDEEGDGDLDLYVANDSNPNYLYRNAGGGRFSEVGLWSGCALSERGGSQAGMGVAVGDPDGDGRPDVLVTNFSQDTCTLYRNLGKGLWADVSAAAGISPPTFPLLSWGCAFADFDLDGDEDLFIANGHIYPQADDPPATGETYRQRNLLLENRGGTFADGAAGPGFAGTASFRGAAAGDLDGDGDVDLVVSRLDGPPALLRNESPRAGRRWLLVDAPGALRVEVDAGGRTLHRFRVRGGSFLSESDPRFHFGLGTAAPERVRVRYPGGRVREIEAPPADRVLVVK